jgi:hypothetical protein
MPDEDYWWRQRVDDALFAAHVQGHPEGAESCWYCEADIDTSEEVTDV